MKKGFLLVILCLLSLHGIAGAKLLVREIQLVGNIKTKPQYILREMTFAEGDSLDTQKLDDIFLFNKQNIFNLELFNSVEISRKIISENLHVTITVKERWYIFPLPSIGIEERNSYDFFKNRNLRRLVYGASLEWNNLSGRNDQLLFKGQLGFSQKFSIEFNRPAILPRQNVDLRVEVGYRNEPEIIFGTDSGQVKWGTLETESMRKSHFLRLGLTKRFNPRKSIYVEASYKHFIFSDSIYQIAPGFITTNTGRESYPSLVVSFVNDQRDYKSFPLDGFKYHIFFRQAGLPEVGTTTFTKAGFTWAHHIPISRRWNFAYGTHNIIALGKQIPYFEKNFIGVDTREFRGLDDNIRGYEQYLINGSFLSMTKFEGKFALFPLKTVYVKQIPFKRFREFPFGLYISAFCDTGYFGDNTENNDDPFLKNRLLAGYGVGLNIIALYDNLVRIEYARNHLNEGGIYFHASVSIK